MNTYKFRYKRFNKWFWKEVVVMWHRYDPTSDHMDIGMPDGTIKSIGSWKFYDLELGKDWIAFTKAIMEEESGVDVKLKASIVK